MGRPGNGGVLGSGGLLGIGVVFSLRQAARCEVNSGVSGLSADGVAVVLFSSGLGMWEPGGRHAAAVGWAAAVGGSWGSDTIMGQGSAVLMTGAAAECFGLWKGMNLCTGDTGAADSCAGCDGMNVGN